MHPQDARWYKSSYSGGSGTECVEAAELIHSVAVRDSKDPEGSRLDFLRDSWMGFIIAMQERRLG
ncbi:hypothetical protein HY68_15870 [Streptomyces sp. AcH 505]|uniref:DUF397 domain-containing protein n=1 Tax=Streptomyces sp. AcH 505 TaxID=352211 RepID=UPI000591EA25|nr:hypothetical protein HY68_15870 [Streptomyces sp. AcH 505]